LSELQHRKIAPEIEALKETLRDNKVIPTLARAVPLTASGAIGLAVTTLVGGPALASAAALLCGVSAAFAKEYLDRFKADAERRKHRLFLLYEATRRLN
jgi:hypothetical protein